MDKHPTLYGLDSKGNIRLWWMEQDGDQYRSVSCVEGGTEVRSEWRTATPRNVGRSNETDGEDQATFEIESEYRVRTERGGYAVRREDAGKKAHFAPMLAAKWKDCKAKTAFPVHAQPKLDGIRCVATAGGLFSRNGKKIYGAPHIEEALEEFFAKNPDAVLDGELYNHDLKADFDEIGSIVRKQNVDEEDLAKSRRLMQYHLYDFPTHPGGFVDRFGGLLDLADLLWKRRDCIRLTQTEFVKDEDDLDALYALWLEAGYEGQMIRVSDSPYANKRVKSLLKRKEFVDAEFEIVRLEEGVGNWKGAVKRVVYKLPDGREFESGIRGTWETNAKLLKEAPLYVGGKGTCRFQNYTPSGKPRFGVTTAVYVRGEALPNEDAPIVKDAMEDF